VMRFFGAIGILYSQLLKSLGVEEIELLFELLRRLMFGLKFFSVFFAESIRNLLHEFKDNFLYLWWIFLSGRVEKDADFLGVLKSILVFRLESKLI
jgi:hypothetical protein